MIRSLAIIFLCGICICAYSQNEKDVKNDIVYSLNDFFSQLSMINDDEEPIRPSTIASAFKGEHYFRFNGQDIPFEDFLTYYIRTILKNNYVNHTLDITRSSINKTTSTAADRRWTVKAKLKRPNATDEDYVIKDEDITMIVKWNGPDKDISILDISFSAPLHIIRPIIKREYRFDIDRKNSILSVPYDGGDWKIALNSWYRDVKSYPGIPEMTTEGDWYLSPFEGKSLDNIKFDTNENPQFISGKLRNNYSKEARTYQFSFTQGSSGKSAAESVTHQRRIAEHWTDYDSDGFHQVELLYSLKYNLGLSYMYNFSDSRFSIGALIALNFDSFRGMKNWFVTQEITQTQTITIGGGSSSNTINGYTISKETINPETSNYSSLMDPYNEAKHYTSRSLYLVQGGVNISQWMAFNLGLGAARARDLYFMDSAYSLDIYKYEATNSQLPTIDDIYVYRNKYKDYYYKDPTKWGVAIRPALTQL